MTVVMPAVLPRKTLTDAGVGQKVLEIQLGISRVSTGAAWRAESEDDLESLLAKSPDWEKGAIVGLVAGLATDEVKGDLGLAPTSPTDETELGDDEIVAQLKEEGPVFEVSEEEFQEIYELLPISWTEKSVTDQWRAVVIESTKFAK